MSNHLLRDSEEQYLIHKPSNKSCYCINDSFLRELSLLGAKGEPLNETETLVSSSSVSKWLLKLLTHQTACFIILAYIYSRVYLHSALICAAQWWWGAERERERETCWNMTFNEIEWSCARLLPAARWWKRKRGETACKSNKCCERLWWNGNGVEIIKLACFTCSRSCTGNVQGMRVINAN